MAKIFNRAGSYLTQAEANRSRKNEDDQIRDAKIDRTISKIALLGKAYQDYQGRKTDRQIFGALTDSRSGGTPNITNNPDPGGGVRYLNPAQLQAQNQGRGQPSQVPQKPQSGILNRIRGSVNQGRSLSPMEQLIATKQLEQLYREPKKWEPRTREAALSFERSKRGLRGRTSNRSPRPLNELREIMELSAGRFSSQETKDRVSELKKAARAELDRYSTRDKNYFPEYTDAQEQDIQDNMSAYGKSREETIDALTRVGALN